MVSSLLAWPSLLTLERHVWPPCCALSVHLELFVRPSAHRVDDAGADAVFVASPGVAVDVAPEGLGEDSNVSGAALDEPAFLGVAGGVWMTYRYQLRVHARHQRGHACGVRR